MGLNAYNVVKKPVLTEKSTFAMNELGQYSFEVNIDSTKPEIRLAIEEIYSVHVERIQTVIKVARNRRNKYGIVPGRTTKRAIVRLRSGERIELF